MLVAQPSNTLFVDSPLAENNGRENQEQGTRKPRKRVTFDMQLQIHTIPNRIPMYERRPAYNNMVHPAGHHSGLLNRGQHQRSLLPRPLDIKNRDRYFVGVANLSTKRIIDLFGSASTRHSSTSSSTTRQRSPSSRNTRRVPQYASPTISSSSRLSQSSGTASGSSADIPPVMSRAAANLKQITDALGEDVREGSPEEQHLGNGISNAGSSEGVSQISSYIGGQQSKTRVQSSPARVQNYSLSQSSHSNSFAYSRDVPDRLRPASLVTPRPEPLDGSKLPIVTSEQIQLSNRYATFNIPKDDQMRMSAHGKNDLFKSSGDEYSDRKDINGNSPNRTPSRCSTIDGYVIDSPDQNSINSASMTTNRRTGSGRGHRRLITTLPSRAWEGLEMSVTQPSLQVNALRTAVPHQSSPVPSYLSTSTSQRSWTNRNAYSWNNRGNIWRPHERYRSILAWIFIC